MFFVLWLPLWRRSPQRRSSSQLFSSRLCSRALLKRFSRPRVLYRIAFLASRNLIKPRAGVLLVLNRPVCETARAMPRSRKDNKNGKVTATGEQRPISLKELAARLDLSPATLSIVLNGSAVAETIPQETKDRIFEAAKKFNYRPNYIARSLRAQRTYTVGVVVPELSDGYSAMVLSGVEDHLLKEGFFYFVASHRHRPELIERCPQFFLERCVEGLIAVDTPQRRPSMLPVVSVSGHDDTPGVTNIALNHERAARLALEHLIGQGHRSIA